MTFDDKQAVALWRLGVLGPLTSARLEHGDRRTYCAEAAARLHERPDGTRVHLSARTIETWCDAYRRGGFHALFPADRQDRGRSRAIAPAIAEQILRVKRERPRRSIRRIIRMLERAGLVHVGALHRSTVHRLLAAHAIAARPAELGPDFQVPAGEADGPVLADDAPFPVEEDIVAVRLARDGTKRGELGQPVLAGHAPRRRVRAGVICRRQPGPMVAFRSASGSGWSGNSSPTSWRHVR
jgi:transposase